MSTPTILDRLTALEATLGKPTPADQLATAETSKALQNHSARLSALENALGVTPPTGTV